ncbi:MAG TPA: dipicolinate synthase subunit DpsA [Syntrophomonadaceae bacterium]|nr:dipicolinate synthase subunit DpsA [Syntrophomonadaceae bacterium]
MESILFGTKIAVVGGDDRELVLISELVKMGAKVYATGFPKDKVGHEVVVVRDIEEVCEAANVLILPVPGTDPKGVIRAIYAEENLKLTEKALSRLSNNALIIIGSAQPFLKEWAKKYNLTLLEIIEMDEVAILNSIPTAEGAIQIAMEETSITIHKSRSCIIGFGRVGITLAKSLKALGADVTIIARSTGQLARAYEMGCRAKDFKELPEIMANSDICYNTVPHMVLDKQILKNSNPSIVIIDLATQPGGTDFEAANLFGLKAILAPGLPGKVAPISAGRILADVVPRLIIREMSSLNKEQLLKNREVL